MTRAAGKRPTKADEPPMLDLLAPPLPAAPAAAAPTSSGLPPTPPPSSPPKAPPLPPARPRKALPGPAKPLPPARPPGPAPAGPPAELSAALPAYLNPVTTRHPDARDYRGAVFHPSNPRMGIVMVDLLGTNLHRHYFPLKTAESLVDWLLDTSGDRTKLPPPYRDIQRRT